jgi:opacity protein-like surface antigen
MRREFVFLATAALFLTLASPASAADSGWNLRIFAAGFDPSLDETVFNDDGDAINVTSGSDLGYGLSLEYQFSDRWGIEGGFMQGNPAVELNAEVPGYGTLSLSDPMKTTVLFADINLHLTPNSPSFDFYLGAGVARMSYNNLVFEIEEIDELLAVDIANETTWSAKAGLDIAIGKGWSAIGTFRFVDSSLKAHETEDGPGDSETFDFKIYNFNVGIAYSF